MLRLRISTLTILIGLTVLSQQVYAQGFGGGGASLGSYANRSNSYSSNSPSASEIIESLLPTETALNVIMIEGAVEVRVNPELLKLVLALTSEGETAEICQQKINAQIEAIRQSWLQELQIPQEDIVEDFISVLPRYEWTADKWEEENIRVQKHNGYRMQSNLHLQVATEKAAMAAIDQAFQHGVAEVVTFDYWSSDLETEKEKAMAAAVEAAKKKSKLLLAVFETPPKVINVQEFTKVFLPSTLYKTYKHILEEDYQGRYWEERPRVKAYRPEMTFYRGTEIQTDVLPKELAMHPEIAVVSVVRIYYQSPAERAEK